MGKKSFNDIEQVIKNTVEAHEAAFKEESWKKMEKLLDKDGNRKRPFIFWLWFLLPLLILTGGIIYFAFNKNGNVAYANNAVPVFAAEQKNLPTRDITKTGIPQLNNPTVTASLSNADGRVKNSDVVKPADLAKKKSARRTLNYNNTGNKEELLYAKNNRADYTNAKMKASIIPASAEADADLITIEKSSLASVTTEIVSPGIKQADDVVIVKIETDSKTEKEIEKIIDSVVEKTMNNKKDKTKISRFYFIVAAGAEASGIKLFAADKITGRAGVVAGYNLNKNVSIQAGFFVSNKKYNAAGSSYKTKPGTYWNIVDIKEVEANCRVYEIPVQVNYNFTPGKKLNIFASVGLSSYIMKKEDYSFYYSRYGTYHKAEVYYSGNKSLFSVLRISGGIEKKVGKQFSLFTAPGIAIPLAGVGEGEVKLYSAEILIGLKFTPARKNK